ncbi:hypothetical protein AMTR_s00060p00189890 [Amborella trichopoda]|uniref:Uncharacterized protein n=1 Tax=Amborella trichopoda TaxID=13333 RepID=W1NL37_AMBTC|nr:hypothetical protein AMTR_s00060p00189890 [Amborella trichopoda]
MAVQAPEKFPHRLISSWNAQDKGLSKPMRLEHVMMSELKSAQFEPIATPGSKEASIRLAMSRKAPTLTGSGP